MGSPRKPSTPTLSGGLSRTDKIFFAGIPLVLGAIVLEFLQEHRSATISRNFALEWGIIACCVVIGAVVGFLRVVPRPYTPGKFLVGMPLCLVVSGIFVGFPAFLATSLIGTRWVVARHQEDVYVVDHWRESTHGRHPSTYETFLVRDASGTERNLRFPPGASDHLQAKTCQILTIRHGALGSRFVALDDPVAPGNPSCAGRNAAPAP